MDKQPSLMNTDTRINNLKSLLVKWTQLNIKRVLLHDHNQFIHDTQKCCNIYKSTIFYFTLTALVINFYDYKQKYGR